MKKTKFILFRELAILIAVLVIAFLANSGMINWNLLTRAKVVPADIMVYTTGGGGSMNTDFYHAFAQGGEERKDMLAPVLADVTALKPKLIRLDHIYDYFPVVNRIDGRLVFDFSGLDGAVSTILQTGAKPMLVLSYMPPSIARDGNILNEPENWEEWAEVVRETVEHFSGKRYRNITGMYYEVWNEPDLAQFGSWKMGGEKNYLTLYKYARQGAFQAGDTNPYFFGGPATTGYYPGWIKGLIGSGMGMDFISWHTYQAEPERFAKDVRDARTLLSSYPKYAQVPVLITESGFTGARDKRYGSAYAAAHAVSVIRRLVDITPQYLFSFEVKDGPGQENGEAWGLLGHETDPKKKPRYGVYNFIDTMQGVRLTLTGEGSDVTGWAVKDGTTVKVMLSNFAPGYQVGQKVPVTFRDMAPGTYTISRKYYQGVEGTETVEIRQPGFAPTAHTLEVYVPASGILLLTLERK